MRAAGLDGQLIHGPYGLVIAPLAAARFCSGHLVWVQQAAQPRQCHSVHATFTEFGDAGKRWRFLEANPSPHPHLSPSLNLALALARWRFLEAGLWGALPTSYFTRGRYLAFTPPIPPPDPAPCTPGEGAYVRGGPPPRPCGGEDPHHGLGPKRGGDVPAEEVRRRSSLTPTLAPTLTLTLTLT